MGNTWHCLWDSALHVEPTGHDNSCWPELYQSSRRSKIPRLDHCSTIDNFNRNLLDTDLLVQSTHVKIDYTLISSSMATWVVKLRCMYVYSSVFKISIFTLNFLKLYLLSSSFWKFVLFPQLYSLQVFLKCRSCPSSFSVSIVCSSFCYFSPCLSSRSAAAAVCVLMVVMRR